MFIIKHRKNKIAWRVVTFSILHNTHKWAEGRVTKVEKLGGEKKKHTHTLEPSSQGCTNPSFLHVMTSPSMLTFLKILKIFERRSCNLFLSLAWIILNFFLENPFIFNGFSTLRQIDQLQQLALSFLLIQLPHSWLWFNFLRHVNS